MAEYKRNTSGRRRVAETAVGYDAFGARERVARVVELLGNQITAELLGVSTSQPGRWRTGKDRVSAESLATVVDLDYLASRMLMMWTHGVALQWLEGFEPHLMARPLDVLRLRGPRALIPALDAIEAGAYA